MRTEADHKVIYLQPKCCVDPYGDGGRQWCQDNVWPDGDHCDKDGIKYIRADLAPAKFRWDLIVLAIGLTLFWIASYKLVF